MSAMLCAGCGRLIDSDYHPEYWREDLTGKDGIHPFYCDNCYDAMGLDE